MDHGSAAEADLAISMTALDAAQAVRGNRYAVFACFCYVGFIGDFSFPFSVLLLTLIHPGSSCVVVFGITAEALKDRLRLSVIESAMLTSTALLAAAVGAVPVSLLTRLYGGRVLCFVLESLAGSALLVLAAVLNWAGDLPSLYGLFVVLGLLLGCGVVVVNAGLVHMSWWFPERSQATVAGVFLFAVSMGPGVFGAFANPAIATMTIQGFFLLWSLLVYAGAIVSLFCFNPPYTQLLRIIRKRNMLVETLPGESSKNLVLLEKSNVTQKQLMVVCREVFQQEVFPESAFLRDLRLSLTRLQNWCIIGIASFTLGALLGFTVWIPTFFPGVFGTDADTAGYIVMVRRSHFISGFLLIPFFL